MVLFFNINMGSVYNPERLDLSPCEMHRGVLVTN